MRKQEIVDRLVVQATRTRRDLLEISLDLDSIHGNLPAYLKGDRAALVRTKERVDAMQGLMGQELDSLEIDDGMLRKFAPLAFHVVTLAASLVTIHNARGGSAAPQEMVERAERAQINAAEYEEAAVEIAPAQGSVRAGVEIAASAFAPPTEGWLVTSAGVDSDSLVASINDVMRETIFRYGVNVELVQREAINDDQDGGHIRIRGGGLDELIGTYRRSHGDLYLTFIDDRNGREADYLQALRKDGYEVTALGDDD